MVLLRPTTAIGDDDVKIDVVHDVILSSSSKYTPDGLADEATKFLPSAAAGPRSTAATNGRSHYGQLRQTPPQPLQQQRNASWEENSGNSVYSAIGSCGAVRADSGTDSDNFISRYQPDPPARRYNYQQQQHVGNSSSSPSSAPQESIL